MNNNRKEKEEQLREEGRMPPGQVLTEKFPVLHYGPIPPFDPSSWDFRIYGEVEKPLKMNWEEFSALPRKSYTFDVHCVTRWSKFGTQWEGIPVQYFIDQELVKLKPQAKFVMQHAAYNFSANLPLDIVLSERFILATHFNGEPLTPEHGYPLRGVVGAIPGQKSDKDVYFWKGAKWLRSLEFMRDDRKGFWEMAGYHNQGKVWEEQRLSSG